jgi:hypothetical protein
VRESARVCDAERGNTKSYVYGAQQTRDYAVWSQRAAGVSAVPG